MKLTYLRALKCFPRKLWVTGYKLWGVQEAGGAVSSGGLSALVADDGIAPTAPVSM